MGLHINWSTGGGFVGKLAMESHPIYRSRIADPAPSALLGAMRGGQPAFPWARVPGGVFVVEGFDAAAGPVPTRDGDLVNELDALVAHATTLDVQNDAALLRFVNRWGLLGLADPTTGTNQYWDSVPMTRDELARFQRLGLWLAAMKNGDRSSSAIPTSRALKEAIGLAVSSRKYSRAELARRAFAKLLNDRMRRVTVRAGLRLQGQQLEPILEPRCLGDLLYVALLHHAGADDTVARRCDGCHGIFFVSATNHRRAYCDPRCKNTAKMRRWRQRKRAATDAVSSSD